MARSSGEAEAGAAASSRRGEAGLRRAFGETLYPGGVWEQLRCFQKGGTNSDFVDAFILSEGVTLGFILGREDISIDPNFGSDVAAAQTLPIGVAVFCPDHLQTTCAPCGRSFQQATPAKPAQRLEVQKADVDEEVGRLQVGGASRAQI